MGVSRLKMSKKLNISNEKPMEELTSLALGILEHEGVKNYINNLKLTKRLKDGQTYYG